MKPSPRRSRLGHRILRRAMAGLRTYGLQLAPTRRGFPAVASAMIATFVPVYRCGAVPDSHRVPSLDRTLWSDHHLLTGV